MLFAEVYYLFTGRSDDIKNTAQIALKLTKKEDKQSTLGKNIYTYLATITRFSSFISHSNYKLVSSHKYLIMLKLQVPFSLVVVRFSHCISS